MNERIDPIEAFLFGISSGFARALIGVTAVISGYSMNSWANTAPERSFLALDSLFMIFTWADFGAAFVIGLISLLGGLYLLYRFMVEEGGKLEWFLILASFTLYYSPMTFPREDWPVRRSSVIALLAGGVGDPVLKNDWIRLLILFASVSAVYWILPAAITSVISRSEESEE
jgi:hypothetical protein